MAKIEGKTIEDFKSSHRWNPVRPKTMRLDPKGSYVHIDNYEELLEAYVELLEKCDPKKDD